MLIGISLGPGDPELLTFKAAAALKSCTKVFVPGEMAAELARVHCQPEILQFPMIEDKEELEKIWRKNADTVEAAAAEGCAGFACIGDVNTFSTFSHLERVIRHNYPQIEIQTIPGVGIVPCLAARFAAPLE
ncbi:MAG: SAM-dependent methyltransferase [Methanothrix sp.]|nr:SAM-dependent methyltransferase [Methanothrix sp.]